MQLLNAVLEGAGIDTSAGLKIVGGKEERYARILLKFADKQAGTVEEIRTMLAAGDNATAERAAHSLKGSAATLGINALADRAGETETAIKQGQGIYEAVEALSGALRTVVSAIQDAVAE
ncbi:MAG: Hpt domain-containing protein [Methyloceanibacter sp.]|jgi:two-component system sensor histidine kinase/response regulator|uniref:Hpt domain-containing protein n=1 Tax=Methyloceanibacter sp. TaxID=1965321 RepID=UPI003C382B0B